MEFDLIKNNMDRDNTLSPYACKNSEALRFVKEKEDIRPAFFRDCNRIIYSLSYMRYASKTQVFTLANNDHISSRMTHVQMVSSIARTIGRALNLNEDLIEAAALGHDLGHTPIGHVGEAILNKISLENNEGYFNHNIQSVRVLKDLERYGKGNNLTYQVMDAIMCHNGERLNSEYAPKEKTQEEFLEEYERSYKEKIHLIPGTLEGCVVRISDVIAYVGKDIEDALTMKLIKPGDLPEEILNVLGSRNRDIINTIVLDVINNSFNKPYIKMSDDVYKAMNALKKYNYEAIYRKVNSDEDLAKFESIIRTVFDGVLNDFNNKESNLYLDFLSKMDSNYINNTTPVRMTIDYISGMTDDYLYKEFAKYNLSNNKIRG